MKQSYGRWCHSYSETQGVLHISLNYKSTQTYLYLGFCTFVLFLFINMKRRAVQNRRAAQGWNWDEMVGSNIDPSWSFTYSHSTDGFVWLTGSKPEESPCLYCLPWNRVLRSSEARRSNVYLRSSELSECNSRVFCHRSSPRGMRHSAITLSVKAYWTMSHPWRWFRSCTR